MDAMMTTKGDVWVSNRELPSPCAYRLRTIASSLTARTTGSSTTSDR